MSLVFEGDPEASSSCLCKYYTLCWYVSVFMGVIAVISGFTYCGLCFFGNRCTFEAVLISATIGLTTVCCVCVICAIVYTLGSWLVHLYTEWKKEREFQRLISNASSIEYD